MKPRAVIVERAAHRRLRMVDALRGEYQVESIEMLDGFVRAVRAIRPEFVLVGIGRRVQRSTRAAHQIKTDGAHPPLVGLMDWDGRLADPCSTAKEVLADGVFSGEAAAEDLQVFLSSLGQEEIVLMGVRTPSFLDRIFRR